MSDNGNVRQFPGVMSRDNSGNSGPSGNGSPPGGGDVEARVAKLESHVEYIRRDIEEVKSDVRSIKSDMREDFRIMFGALIATALGLSALMAKGFGWL